MVHNGVVLQQFTLKNIADTPIDIGPFAVRSGVYIRDLDFLNDDDSFNEKQKVDETKFYDGLGPMGHGHVYMHMLPYHGADCGHTCTQHAVASVNTIFVNGSAVDFESQDGDTSTFVETFHVSSNETVEIVLARKLLVVPQGQSYWRNFIIGAKDGNINQWLWDERASGMGDDLTTRCLAKLPAIIKPDRIKMMTARDDAISDGANEKNAESNSAEVATNKSTGSYPKPSGSSSSEKDWNPNDHLQYFAWRHLEHILSVCAMPLSKPGLIKVSDVKIPDQDTSTPIALTCGDISGHRINTSASL
jgi:hypothetical protein